MVKSGLNDQSRANTNEPRVSQYRLAAHLGLAFAVFSGLFYQSLTHLLKENPVSTTKFSFFLYFSCWLSTRFFLYEIFLQ